MSEHDLREQWRAWGRGQSIPDDRLEPAVEAALRVAATGASADAAAAAARVAGGRSSMDDLVLLQGDRTRAGAVVEELSGLSPAGPVTAEALAERR